MITILKTLAAKALSFFFSDEGKVTALVSANVGAGTAHATASAMEPILHDILYAIQILIAVLTAIYVWRKLKSPKKGGKDLLLIIGMSFMLALPGCVLAQKGGRSSFTSPSGLSGAVEQSENPKTPTEQVLERVTEVTTPGGITTKTTEKLATKIGASQKDTAREFAAKLGSLKAVVWVGILMFIFGAASLAWPPLKVIVGSTTTSLIAVAAGIALMALPSLIVGHELLILILGVVAVLGYWFAHRHGHLRGELKTLTK